MSQADPHILLVEDSEMHAELIREALLAWSVGVRISVASSLTEARAFLAETPPDLALIDLMLPDGDGIALLEQVRLAHPQTRVTVTTGASTLIDPKYEIVAPETVK